MPRDAIVENPVINSPFRQPDRRFRFDEEGITSDVVDGRRPSSYFVQIPSARTRGGQRSFETEWTSDRLQGNSTINRIRERIDQWRQGSHLGLTPTDDIACWFVDTNYNQESFLVRHAYFTGGDEVLKVYEAE